MNTVTIDRSCVTDGIKACAREEGADLVGIAPAERWKHAPIELSPRGIWPASRSVIVIAINLTDGGTELSGVEVRANLKKAGARL